MNCMPSCPVYCCKRSSNPRPPAKKNENQMEDEDNCPALCYKRCAPICPRRCCGPKSSSPLHPQRPNVHIADLPYGSQCPHICKDVCALECPHRCCGPGSFRRHIIPRPKLTLQRSQFPRFQSYRGYRTKKSVAPRVSRSYIRRFGYPKV